MKMEDQVVFVLGRRKMGVCFIIPKNFTLYHKIHIYLTLWIKESLPVVSKMLFCCGSKKENSA